MIKQTKTNVREIDIHQSLLENLSSDLRRALFESCRQYQYKLKVYKRWPVKTILETISKNPTHLMMASVTDLDELTSVNKRPLPFNNIILIPPLPNEYSISKETNETQPVSEALVAKLESVRFLIGTQSHDFFKSLLSAILAHADTVQRPTHTFTDFFLDRTKLKTKVLVLKRSVQRIELQKSVQDFFSEQISQNSETLAPGISSYPKNLADVLDELLMNAIWDANPSREHLARNIPIVLDEKESIQVECGFDGTYLSLCVLDSHGTFPSRAIRGPLRYALGIKNTAKVNEGPGGAGLGLYMVLQKTAALAFEIDRGHTTRACAILRADTSLREMQRQPRSLLLFDKSDGEKKKKQK